MEEESMDMDTEVEEQLPKSVPDEKSSKRFSLRNSIHTTFGDDYVFEIAPKFDWTLMGVSLSTNAVKLYSPETGQYCGECNGHSSTINHISFSGPTSPHVLHSCSSDGTIRAWDTRNFKEIMGLSAGPSQEIFSFSFGGSSGNLLSAGCKSQILFWDWRNKKQVACLEESHIDDVTHLMHLSCICRIMMSHQQIIIDMAWHVHFSPDHPNKLISASVDGLICTFDTAGDIDDDDHMDSVINVGTSIGKVGMFGQNHEKLWCLTHIETLSIWDLKNGSNVANFEDARASASRSWTLDQVNYFVDCHSTEGTEDLWVIGGTNSGTLGYFPVSYNEKPSLGFAEAALEGGHMGVVRSVVPMSGAMNSRAQRQGIFGWTGGEDGRLCCWFSLDVSPGMDRSWMSSSLVQRTHHKKNRHQPY